jgi:enhancing lycopene biosynthesis protein 2
MLRLLQERTMDTTNERDDPELQQMRALHAEIMAETARVMAETARISREPLWHPIAIALGLLLAGTALGVGWVALAKMLA